MMDMIDDVTILGEHGQFDTKTAGGTDYAKTAGGTDYDMIRHSGTRIQQTSFLIPFLLLISLSGSMVVTEFRVNGHLGKAEQYSTG